MHHTIPRLYRDTALPIVRAFSRAIFQGSHLKYTQVNGVRIDLPTYRDPVVLIPEDFEKVLDIFEGDTYGARIRAQWELGIPDEAFYDLILQEAVAELFPEFP